MNTDKIFYGTWGTVIVMIGIAVLIGMKVDLGGYLGIFLLWLFLVGIVLLVVGMATITKDSSTAMLQLIAGMILSVISLGGLALYRFKDYTFEILALILVIVGVSIIIIGLSKKR